MKRCMALESGWSVSADNGISAPATVPGVVHTDLLAAGLIPDPYLDDNESKLGWIGRTQWRYQTSFMWQPEEADVHELVCDGLDTLATIELNGTLLGTTANQHRSYRFDVTTLLRPGANDLVITFDSALDHAERVAAEHPRPHVNRHPYNAIRKMACNFGWDWGPDLVTAGIWRPIGIESWSVTRIAAVRPLVVTATEDTAVVRFDIDLERARPAASTCVVSVGSVTKTIIVPGDATHATVDLEIAQPALWWPRGHGDQPLYETSVVLDGLDEWHTRIGVRTVELDTTDGGFGIRINGKDVFVRGANWIPDDAFPSRVDRDRYARRIHDACEAGINLLRVWGGGIYESEDFYQLCDELGVMVWQDFLFACAAYAEELLWDEVEAEARQAVTRLCTHPSLVIWNGANENLWGFADWGWRDQLNGASWGEGFYYDLLPSIVADLDPTRPYLPGSPYSPDRADHPNDPATGLVHIWDVWNEKDYRAYRGYRPRFVAEFGFQGPPTFSTMSAFGDTVHQKAEDGEGKLDRGRRGHFPDPADPDAWHWTTQLNQARAITFGVEWFRSLAPRCRGTILWQLNDCWPVVSWAAVDGYGRRKPLWYALRRAYAERLVTVQPRAGVLAAVLVNDSSEPWYATLRLRRLRLDGLALAAGVAAITVPPRQTLAVPLGSSITTPVDPSNELICIDGETRTYHFFVEDIDLALPKPEFAGTVSRTPTGYTVEITARTLLRDLTLQTDRLDPDAVVDDQLITLLPGEKATFAVTSTAELDETDLLTHPVLRTANALLTERPRTCSEKSPSSPP